MGFLFETLKKKKNTVRKGENADNQHFLLFLQCFQMVFTKWEKGLLTIGIVW